jgi:hypothetical protein
VSTNGFIGGWQIDSDSIFKGTKISSNTRGTINGHITLGDGYISGPKFTIRTDGRAQFDDLEVRNVLTTTYLSSLTSSSTTATSVTNRSRVNSSPYVFFSRTISNTARYIDIIRGTCIPPHLRLVYKYDSLDPNYYFKGTFGYIEARIYNSNQLVKTILLTEIGGFSYGGDLSGTGQIIINQDTFETAVESAVLEIPVESFMTRIELV